MAGIDAFVAEDAADLIDAIDAANHRLLEVKLGGDAKMEVFVQSVMVRDERASGRAAGNGVKNRSFHFDEAEAIAVVANLFDDARTEDRDVAGILVDDHVDIAMTITVFGVG